MEFIIQPVNTGHSGIASEQGHSDIASEQGHSSVQGKDKIIGSPFFSLFCLEEEYRFTYVEPHINGNATVKLCLSNRMLRHNSTSAGMNRRKPKEHAIELAKNMQQASPLP